MQVIEIVTKEKTYRIKWALPEHFEELVGKLFNLDEVSVEQISSFSKLSIQKL